MNDTAFSIFCCSRSKLLEMCCWYQIQNKHVFTKNNEAEYMLSLYRFQMSICQRGFANSDILFTV